MEWGWGKGTSLQSARVDFEVPSRPRGVQVDYHFLIRKAERVQRDVGAVGPRTPVVGVECHFEEERDGGVSGRGFVGGSKGEIRGR